MVAVGEWLQAAVLAQQPDVPVFRMGFHAIPTMDRLHLHVVSQDFDAPTLRSSRHWNSFNTDFFVPPDAVLRALAETGAFAVNHTAMAALKAAFPLRCWRTNRTLRSMAHLRAHLRSAVYLQSVARPGQPPRRPAARPPAAGRTLARSVMAPAKSWASATLARVQERGAAHWR